MEKDEKAPHFCLPDKDNNRVGLKNFAGKWVVLYFYPRDGTKGCTQEALDFTEYLPDFEQMNAVVVGISPDSTESHQKFAQKHQLQVILLSDPEHTVSEQYGVWQLKKMYGREFYGVIRSTFIIDPEGTIAYSWRKVRVKNHVTNVNQKLKELQEV